MRNLGAIGVRHLAERKGRTALTAAGITLGVALFVGALIAAGTTTRGMDRLAGEVAGQADVLVSPAGGAGANLLDPAHSRGLGEADLGRLAALPDVLAVGGVIGFPTVVSTQDGRSTLLAVNRRTSQASLAGVDLALTEVFPVTFLDGRRPTPGADELALPIRMADDLGLVPGEQVTVSTPTGDRALELVGVLSEEGVGRLQTVGFTTIETARALAGQPPDAVSFVAIRLDPGQEATGWINANDGTLGPGLTAVPATASIDRFRDQLTMLSAAMTVMAAAVLFSAGYLIYLTLSMTVVERTRLYGTLHALGATRAQVRRVVLLEALGMGAVATLVGVGLGVLVAVLLNTVTARFLELIGSPPVHVPPWALLAGVAFGLLTTVISALVPARRAARLDPVAAMREAYAAPGPRAGGWVLGAGLLSIGTIVLLRSSAVGTQVVGLLAVLGGAIRLVAPVIGPLAGSVRRLVSTAAPGTGEIAVLHLRKEPSRSAATLALVMLVMAITFATGAMTVSYVRGIEREVDRTFTNDLTLFAASTFDEHFVAAVREHPDVAAASPIGRAQAYLVDGSEGDGRSFVYVDVIEPASYFDMAGYLWADGDDSAARAALERGRAVILPAPLADRIGARRGDHVTLDTLEGPVELEVAALAHLSNIPPKIVVGEVDGRDLLGVPAPGTLAVNVRRGSGVDSAADAIERDLASHATFIVTTSGDLRADARAQVLGVSNGFFVLLLLAGLVGLFGLANTMAVSVIQRTREIGVLRAIGARRLQVGAMAVVEAMTLVLIAFVLAVPLGGLISGPLMQATSAGIGDFEVPYVFPWLMVPIVALLSLAVGAVAATWPARRAAATEIDVALRLES